VEGERTSGPFTQALVDITSNDTGTNQIEEFEFLIIAFSFCIIESVDSNVGIARARNI